MMRLAFEDASLREAVAARGAEVVRTKYSPEAVGAHYAKRIGEIGTILSAQQHAAKPDAGRRVGAWSTVLNLFGGEGKPRKP
jgi:hypothetical protein